MVMKGFLDLALLWWDPPRWCPPAAQYLPESEKSLRPGRKAECFPWILVSGDSYTLSLLVVSDSPGFVNRTPVPPGVDTSHSGLPYVAKLGVGKH